MTANDAHSINRMFLVAKRGKLLSRSVELVCDCSSTNSRIIIEEDVARLLRYLQGFNFGFENVQIFGSVLGDIINISKLRFFFVYCLSAK